MNKCKNCLCLKCEYGTKTRTRECELSDCDFCEKYGTFPIKICRKYIEKREVENEKCRQNNKKI